MWYLFTLFVGFVLIFTSKPAFFKLVNKSFANLSLPYETSMSPNFLGGLFVFNCESVALDPCTNGLFLLNVFCNIFIAFVFCVLLNPCNASKCSKAMSFGFPPLIVFSKL
jgi:hypothetical protein